MGIHLTAIKQINGKYLPQQDRLLIRINTDTNEEFRLFFTRRVSEKMVNTFQEFILAKAEAADSRMAASEIQEFKREAIIKSNPFKGNFESGVILPLGEHPKLVYDLKVISSNKNKKDNITLHFVMHDKTQLRLVFGDYLMRVMIELLNKLQQKASWAISINLTHTQKNEIVNQVRNKAKLH